MWCCSSTSRSRLARSRLASACFGGKGEEKGGRPRASADSRPAAYRASDAYPSATKGAAGPGGRTVHDGVRTEGADISKLAGKRDVDWKRYRIPKTVEALEGRRDTPAGRGAKIIGEGAGVVCEKRTTAGVVRRAGVEELAAGGPHEIESDRSDETCGLTTAPEWHKPRRR